MAAPQGYLLHLWYAREQEPLISSDDGPEISLKAGIMDL